MSTQVSILPSVAEMEAAQVRAQTFQDQPLAVVLIAGLSIDAHGAGDIADLAATLHRLGDELTVALEVTP